jgi:hypothetical protein
VSRPPAAALRVDPKVHAAEVARFRSKIVTGPREEECSIWTGSIGPDGYGGYYITREGMRFCVRPNRYALALNSGEVLSADVFALHECDIPFLGGFQRVAAASRGGGCPREQHRSPRRR